MAHWHDSVRPHLPVVVGHSFRHLVLMALMPDQITGLVRRVTAALGGDRLGWCWLRRLFEWVQS